MNENGHFQSTTFRRVAALAVALAALLIYLFLLQQWRVPREQVAESVAATSDQPARLELSRRLSPVDSGGVAPVIDAATTRPSLLGPLLGFTVALLAGALAARQWSAAQSRSGNTQPSPPPENTRPSDHAPPIARPDDAQASAAPAEMPLAATDQSAATEEIETPNDVEHALRARDKVIGSLEGIVAENRENWNRYEQERDQMQKTIAQLEADLEASNAIIDDLQRGARLGQTIEGDSAELPHQVLKRA